MTLLDAPMQAPRRLGILAGAFNPPTVAHAALADAARRHVDKVLWVLPGELPHKKWHGATQEQRVSMLRRMRRNVAISSGGLFVDIARECRDHFGPQTRLSFLCGRDAAERIITWDYGRPGVLEEMFREFDLLVAARQGEFEPPARWSAHVQTLPVQCGLDEISSSSVRARVARGEPWEHLVPPEIVGSVREFYPRRCDRAQERL